MRLKIIQSLINTYKLNPSDGISKLDSSEVEKIRDLPKLVSLLSNEKTSPKEIAIALELVVLHIKMEDEQTANEIELLKQIKELVYKPMKETTEEASLAMTFCLDG